MALFVSRYYLSIMKVPTCCVQRTMQSRRNSNGLVKIKYLSSFSCNQLCNKTTKMTQYWMSCLTWLDCTVTYGLSWNNCQIQHIRRFSSASRLLKAIKIDGKAIAQEINDEVKKEVEALKAAGKRVPHLAVLLVGNDPASVVYVKNKAKAAEYTEIETYGKNAVVCGRSKNVGLPIALHLHSDSSGGNSAGDATTTICHRNTPPDQLKFFTRAADILITATGVPGLVTADMVKDGVVVIDIGITRVVSESGRSRLVGDVDYEGVSEKASYITPVPGGVGPVTVAMVIKNTLAAYKNEIDFGRSCAL